MNISATSFPTLYSLYIQFMDIASGNPAYGNTLSISNCIFENTDARALDFRFADWAHLHNNSFPDAGGRSPDSVAVVFMQMNPLRTKSGILNLTENAHWQNKSVLYPDSVTQTRTVWGAAYWITGMPIDSKLCMANNTAYGLRIGMRLSGGNYSVVVNNCLNGTLNPPQFGGDQDPLRRYERDNPGIKGTLHDMIWCETYQDFAGTCVTCSNQCIPPDPPECTVSITNASYVPTHPWWGKYLFTDINIAISDCKSDPYLVRVDPGNPYTPYITTINPVFPPTHPVFNTSIVVVPTVLCQGPIGQPLEPSAYGEGNIVKRSGPLATIEGCNHKLDIGRLRMESCIFHHPSSCSAGVATWQQFTTTSAPSPLLLELVDVTFLADPTSTSPALAGVFDDNFLLSEANFTGYRGSYTAIITGRDCSVDVTVRKSVWDEAPGTALTITNVGGYAMDQNNFNECGCKTPTTFDACTYTAVCSGTTDPHSIHIYRNDITRATGPYITQPRPSGLYCTGYYIDNVPDDDIPVKITANMGDSPGVGMRFDHMPNSCPANDQKEKLRKYALSSHNLGVRGDVHHLMWVRETGAIVTDPTVDSNKNFYACHFCDGT